MTTSMNTILIIGGTAGIGAAFAERFHSLGKKLIVTGRNEERLSKLKTSLKGIETYAMDMTKVDKLPADIDHLFRAYPDIDTVWINGGIQYTSQPIDGSTSSDEKYLAEITTNLTAPLIIARHAVPLLAAKKTSTTLMFTSSGIAFVPSKAFPVYSATKAGIHAYAVTLRQWLKDSTVHILELTPPYVNTDIDAGFKEVTAHVTPMTLDDYVNESFAFMEGKTSKELKEIPAGSAHGRVDLWRESIGKRMIEMGFSD